LEVIRREAGLSVRRFRELAGISESTWYRQRARALCGRPTTGPWPRPTRDRVTAVVHAYASRYPAWGHRKIWALTVADGHEVSMRTVHRILDERGLRNGRRYQAERRELAKVRRQTFHEPPTRRHRVWQTDFYGSSATRPR
jgi:putative transposase